MESSLNPFSEKNINKNLNSIASITFGMTKMIANLVDTGLDWLYNVEVVNQFADKVGKISTALWENLYAAFGVLLFTIAVLYIFFQYVGQKNGMKAGQSTVRLIVVILIAFVWFTQAGWFLKAMNNVSSEVQGLIMKSGTLFNDERDIAQGEELEGSIALLRNQYFDIAVYKPYLNMNYGMTDESKITKDDKDRITKLLEYKLNEDGYKERKKIASSEANELNNTMMAQSGIPNKIGVAIFSLGFACVLGVPLLLVAFVNFIVQILVLAISVILPISFIISFLPNFSNSAWYTLGRLVGAFFMKAFVGIILLFTFLIIDITGELIPMDTP
ncbi:CD3337/EF1877 family mobilome membrane protein, partial [Streptomyces rubiginosohelvolus]|uniref:CD3337/EF1877 family mobilome membrane protein n=1 Tax=Streptomyces rubiginosohelvolus TaxID=67362 RepID=UPI003691DE5D